MSMGNPPCGPILDGVTTNPGFDPNDTMKDGIAFHCDRSTFRRGIRRSAWTHGKGVKDAIVLKRTDEWWNYPNVSLH